MFERKRNVEIPTDIPKRIKFGFVIRYSTRLGSELRENQVAESKSRTEIPEDSTRLRVTDCLLSYFLHKRWSGRRQGELVNWFSLRPRRLQLEEFTNDNKRKFLCHLTSPRCIVILFLFCRRYSPGKQIFLRLTRFKVLEWRKVADNFSGHISPLIRRKSSTRPPFSDCSRAAPLNFVYE